jgi:hypothetical protein
MKWWASEWEILQRRGPHLTDLYLGLNVDADVGPPSVRILLE